jgi:DNA-binding PadR family transcriptional regulator
LTDQRELARQPKRISRAALVTSVSDSDDDASFDRLVYERVRLGIMSALAVWDELTFSEMKALFNVSNGNLGTHARKLEEAKYVTCTKLFEGRRPKSVYRLTVAGRAALNRYLDHVEALLRATRHGPSGLTSPSGANSQHPTIVPVT